MSTEKRPGLVFRPLTENDLDQLVDLEGAVFPLEAWPAQILLEELRSPWSLYLGAFSGEQLVGYGGIKGEREGDLMSMAVQADWRGMGIGKTILLQLVDHAKRRGMKSLFLEVRASNRVARDLYLEFGFTELRTVPAYYRHPTETAVTMGINLDS